MPMIYLYGLIKPDHQPSVLPFGVGGEPVQLHPYRDVVVIKSPIVSIQALKKSLTDLEEEATQSHPALVHDQVLDHFLQEYTVIPFRFLSYMKDVNALENILNAQYQRLLSLFDEINQQVEYGLKIIWNPPLADQSSPNQTLPPERQDTDSPARRYLQEKFKAYQQKQLTQQMAETLVRELNFPLAKLSTRSQLQILPNPQLLLNAHYLIDRSRVASFCEQYRAIQAQRKELRFLLSGPWAPYHFVDLKI